MGVKGFFQFVESEAKKAGVVVSKPISIDHFEGLAIAIDTSITMNQILAASRSENGYDHVNNKGIIVTHMFGILSKSINYLSRGVTPVWVLDGFSGDNKSLTRKQRSDAKVKAKEQYDAALNDPTVTSKQLNSLFSRTIRIEPEMIDLLKQMFLLAGIPFIQAPGEADPLCAYLTRRDWKNEKYYRTNNQLVFKRICRAVHSEDSDILVHLSKYMVRGTKLDNLKLYDCKQIRTLLGLTKQQFRILCVGSGCDYSMNIKGVAIKTFYKDMKMIMSKRPSDQQVKTITDITEYYQMNTNRDIGVEQVDQMKECELFFMDAMNELDKIRDEIIDEDKLQLGLADREMLIEFLVANNTMLEKSYIESLVDRLVVLQGKDENSQSKNTGESRSIDDVTFL